MGCGELSLRRNANFSPLGSENYLILRGGLKSAFHFLLHDHRSPDFHVFEEFLGHVMGHADAAVGGGVAGKVSCMHADSAVEAHEIRHRGVVFHLTRFDLIHAEVRVVIDHLASSLVLDHAVKRGFVILAFLGDLEVACVRPGALFSGGDFGNSDEDSAFVETGFLLSAVDLDQGGAAHIVAVPVGNVVRDRGRGVV